MLLSFILLLAFLVSAGPIPDVYAGGAYPPEGDHNAMSFLPSGSEQPHVADIIARGEINPVAQKFATTPDSDMPGYPDFSPLSKTNLSSYDDSLLQLSSTEPMQGMYPVNRPIGNGYGYVPPRPPLSQYFYLKSLLRLAIHSDYTTLLSTR